LHLIHNVSKAEVVLRIGKSMTAAGAGMTEGERRRTKDAPRSRARVFHESGGKRGWDLKHSIDTVGQSRGHPGKSFSRKKSATIEFTAISQHRIKFCEG